MRWERSEPYTTRMQRKRSNHVPPALCKHCTQNMKTLHVNTFRCSQLFMFELKNYIKYLEMINNSDICLHIFMRLIMTKFYSNCSLRFSLLRVRLMLWVCVTVAELQRKQSRRRTSQITVWIQTVYTQTLNHCVKSPFCLDTSSTFRSYCCCVTFIAHKHSQAGFYSLETSIMLFVGNISYHWS